MESSSQDRNLPASERKLEKAREDGQVTRSRELSNLAVLGVGAISVLALSPLLFGQLKTQLVQQLSFDARVMADQASMLQRLALDTQGPDHPVLLHQLRLHSHLARERDHPLTAEKLLHRVRPQAVQRLRRIGPCDHRRGLRADLGVNRHGRTRYSV